MSASAGTSWWFVGSIEVFVGGPETNHMNEWWFSRARILKRSSTCSRLSRVLFEGTRLLLLKNVGLGLGSNHGRLGQLGSSGRDLCVTADERCVYRKYSDSTLIRSVIVTE